jgi:hypothetical protein
MAEIVLNVRVFKTGLLVKLNAKSGLIADLDSSVFINKVFVGHVFSPIHIAVHNFKNTEVGTARGKLKGCGVGNWP